MKFGLVTPNQLKITTDSYGRKFIGEHNSDNKINGRGIFIRPDGTIFVRYFNDGAAAPGNEIIIYDDGEFYVG